MKALLVYLFLSASMAATTYAGEADEPSARDYNLSMAGALISNWCESNWQTSDYLSIHACNYQLSQTYDWQLSSAHFEECTVEAIGDIVKIADCMVSRFNTWRVKEPL
jgi:hypothetical protein